MADVVIQGARGRARLRRDLFVFGGLACGTALLFAMPAWALSKTCLTGKDPSVVNDAAQIRTVRATIASSCGCAAFDGSGKGKSHADYVKCAAGVISSEAAAGHLRTQCKGTVKKFYSQSACGFKASLGKVACVKTVNGKVSCAIKGATACQGSPNQLVCDDWPACVDASDTNGDLVVGTGPSGTDSGQCTCPAGLGDCNGLAADGCETNVATNLEHCGRCGHECRLPSGFGATTACTDGACVGQCPTGQQLCESTEDGAGACAGIGDACPQLTDVVGNATGGTTYFDICPRNSALAGITFDFENGSLAQIGGACNGFQLAPDTTLSIHGGEAAAPRAVPQTLQCPVVAHPRFQFTGGSDPFELSCPLFAYAAVGFQTSSGAGGITQLSLRCAPVAVTVHLDLASFRIQITAISLGSPITTAPVGPGGGSTSVIECPAGSGANAIRTNAGAAVDAIGLGCSPLPVGRIFPIPINVICG